MSARMGVETRWQAQTGLWFAAFIAAVAVALLAFVVMTGPKATRAPVHPAPAVASVVPATAGGASTPAVAGNQHPARVVMVNGHPCWGCTPTRVGVDRDRDR